MRPIKNSYSDWDRSLPDNSLLTSDNIRDYFRFYILYILKVKVSNTFRIGTTSKLYIGLLASATKEETILVSDRNYYNIKQLNNKHLIFFMGGDDEKRIYYFDSLV